MVQKLHVQQIKISLKPSPYPISLKMTLVLAIPIKMANPGIGNPEQKKGRETGNFRDSRKSREIGKIPGIPKIFPVGNLENL